MQITQFRTAVHARHRTVGIRAESPTIGGIVIDYARFVEVQQRRARVLAELSHRAADAPPAMFGIAVEDQSTDRGGCHGDASTIGGAADVC